MRSILLASVFTLALSAPASAASSGSDVSVEFLEPENYRDFKASQLGSKKERDDLQAEFRKKVVDVAERYLPPGYKMALRFRDIDMAGEYEPQLGPKFNDVRIIRAIYPPSILVDYQVTNEAGEIVASGSRRMTDLAFQNTVSFRRDEPFFYEVELVRDMVREITRNL